MIAYGLWAIALRVDILSLPRQHTTRKCASKRAVRNPLSYTKRYDSAPRPRGFLRRLVWDAGEKWDVIGSGGGKRSRRIHGSAGAHRHAARGDSGEARLMVRQRRIALGLVEAALGRYMSV
jgi:hypothetical protein